MIVRKHVKSEAELFEIVDAANALRAGFSLIQRWQQQRGENADDRNDAKQFDERECVRPPTEPSRVHVDCRVQQPICRADLLGNLEERAERSRESHAQLREAGPLAKHRTKPIFSANSLPPTSSRDPVLPSVRESTSPADAVAASNDR